jgi:hypothetical protein
VVGPARGQGFSLPDAVNPSGDEIDATIDWLAHLAAGRIEVK